MDHFEIISTNDILSFSCSFRSQSNILNFVKRYNRVKKYIWDEGILQNVAKNIVQDFAINIPQNSKPHTRQELRLE